MTAGARRGAEAFGSGGCERACPFERAMTMQCVSTKRTDMADRIDSFSGDYRFLSNFHPSPIVVRSIVFPTVEHAYQAAKYRKDVADRTGLQASMAAVPSPGVAKRRGRAIELRPDWETVKIPIMRALLGLKFADEGLRALLRATAPAELVEGNTWGDRFWGVCNGQGENHLGRLLMEVRAGSHDRV
jgi:ribA/ribD-fused uncharacterized protein